MRCAPSNEGVSTRSDVKKVCTEEMKWCARSISSKVGVQVRVRGAERWAQVGEVGCEKNVYGASKMVCTKHLVAVSMSECARCIDKRRVCSVLIKGGEVGGGDRDRDRE
ncbi:hypothetical protein PMAC_002581 [Pneumocystis sp. 'macacae']|nr:hypothetical protein PMAC_002581 [Pneumocystis sp. 'macacae']